MRIFCLTLVSFALFACQSPAVAGRQSAPTLVPAPGDVADVAQFVATELAKPAADKQLLVYVGAKWCEPCRHFHAAVEAGEVERSIPGARFVEFDFDASKAALERAGYSSKLLPLFAFPNPDGTASARRIEGSVKGPESVASNLVPRLRALLDAR